MSIISNNKKWYYLLVNGERLLNNVPIKTYGLLNDHPINSLDNKLVICVQSSEKNRLYSVFDSYLDFFTFVRTIPIYDQHFYEIIFGSYPQKPHFDLDFTTVDDLVILIDQLNNEIKITPQQILELLIASIINTFLEFNVNINIRTDLCIYTSHGTNKWSYHIIIANYCHKDNIEARNFYDLVVAKIPDYIIKAKCIDNSVYSVKQQFRILGSTKYGKNRTKKFLEQFTYLDQIIKHQYITESSSQKDLLQLETSLISNCNNCILLPKFGSSKNEELIKVNTITALPDIILDNKMVNESIILFSNISKIGYFNSFFKISKINGGLIILKILRPYNCIICNRMHEGENPYLRVNANSSVIYYCRRSGTNKHIGFLQTNIIVNETVVNELNQMIQGNNITENIETKKTHIVGLTNFTEENEDFTTQSLSLTSENTNQSLIPENINTNTIISKDKKWDLDPISEFKKLSEIEIIKRPKKIIQEIFDFDFEVVIPKYQNSEIDDLFI